MSIDLVAEVTLAEAHGAVAGAVLVSEDVLLALDQLLPLTGRQVGPDRALLHAVISFLSLLGTNNTITKLFSFRLVIDSVDRPSLDGVGLPRDHAVPVLGGGELPVGDVVLRRPLLLLEECHHLPVNDFRGFCE